MSVYGGKAVVVIALTTREFRNETHYVVIHYALCCGRVVCGDRLANQLMFLMGVGEPMGKKVGSQCRVDKELTSVQ
jgi:hypothetical protein